MCTDLGTDLDLGMYCAVFATSRVLGLGSVGVRQSVECPVVLARALGSPTTAAQGVRSLRRRGRHVQLGLLLAGDAAPPVPMLELIKRELTITGGHGMPARRYPEMLRFVRECRLDVGALIGERRPLSDAHEAMQAMGRFAPRGVTLLKP